MHDISNQERELFDFSVTEFFCVLEQVCCVFFLHRLKKMPQSMPEYALTRNYLELMVELPWNKSTTGKPKNYTFFCSLIVTQKAHAVFHFRFTPLIVLLLFLFSIFLKPFY